MDTSAEQAFADVYGRHSGYVRAIARRHLRNEAEADDLVQDVFLQAWRQFDRFDHARADVQTWLGVIARSRAIDRLRRRTVRQRVEDPHGDLNGVAMGADPWMDAEAGLTAGRLRAIIPALSPITRQVIELAYGEDLSQRQIAARVGATLGVVKSRLRQGLTVIRDELHQPRELSGSVAPPPREHALTIEDIAGYVGTTRETAPPIPTLDGVQVLVVDDDARTREVLQAVLERSGADAVTRCSAVAACQSLETFWPDVLLADITMPGLDGYGLIRHVQELERQNGMQLPAIALTGLGTEHDRSRALSAGFRTHISKPVHPSAVLVAIAQLVCVIGPLGRPGA